MKPVVVGRYTIDGYLTLFITTTLVNITSIDCTEACIFYTVIFLFLVNIIHLKDDNKHKYQQSEEDNQYNYPFYYEVYQTRISPTVNDMKYIISTYFYNYYHIYRSWK